MCNQAETSAHASFMGIPSPPRVRGDGIESAWSQADTSLGRGAARVPDQSTHIKSLLMMLHPKLLPICTGLSAEDLETILFIHVFTEKISGSLAKGENPKVPLLGLGSSNLPLIEPPLISSETPKALPSYLFIILQFNFRLPSPWALQFQPWSFSTSPSPPPGTHI